MKEKNDPEIKKRLKEIADREMMPKAAIVKVYPCM